MFSIYEITGPTGKRYVGYTGQPVQVRFDQHLRRARKRKTPHPFYDSIKKYGCLGFNVRESKKKVLSCSAYREKLRLGAKRSWENMSEEKRAERIAKMSASLRKRNAEKREAAKSVG